MRGVRGRVQVRRHVVRRRQREHEPVRPNGPAAVCRSCRSRRRRPSAACDDTAGVWPDRGGVRSGRASGAPATLVGIMCTAGRRGEEQRRQIGSAEHDAAADLRACGWRRSARPRGSSTHTPPGPEVQMLPSASHSMPSRLPSLIVPSPILSRNMRHGPRLPSGLHVERLDVGSRRVVDVEDRLVGGEAQSVGLLELVRLDDELDRRRLPEARGRRP